MSSVPPADRAAEIRARLDAVSTGPWSTEYNDYGDEWWFGGSSGDGENVLSFGDDDCGVLAGRHRSEAALIANAPTDLAYLLGRVEELEGQRGAVGALHVRERRYTDPDGNGSWTTAARCSAEADIPMAEVEHFDICAHCGELEMSFSVPIADYMDAMWPCATAKALGLGEATDET
ncbi:hypothetical protein [Glycomyces sp. NPDC048151]|uniref:hypothetical protein n=1 Tax=Glycomyces sp. NPDC048151 TaxID=3364002 RepID=UPI003711AEE5